MRIRPNFAVGNFYSNDKNELIRMFEAYIKLEKNTIDYSLRDKQIIGGVVPHAGHVYCAGVAIHFFEILKASKQFYDVVILVNPNHTGKGLPVSIDDHDYWESPFGKIEIDKDLAEITGIPFDTLSQQKEHSGEVIIPYIQYFLGDRIKLLPISFGAQSSENAQILGKLLFKACEIGRAHV